MRELPRDRRRGGPGLLHPTLELGDARLPLLEVVELARDTAVMLEDRLDAPAVLPLQPRELLQSVLQVGQLLGVRMHRAPVATKRPRGFVHLSSGPLDELDHRSERGIEPGELIEHPADLAEQVDHGAIAGIQHVLGLSGPVREPGGVLEPVALGRPPRLITGRQGQVLDLFSLKPQEILAVGSLTQLTQERLELARRKPKGLLRRPHLSAKAIEPRRRVEQLEVHVGVRKGLGLVLRGHVAEARRQLPELGERDEPPVEVRPRAPAAAIGRHEAPHGELVVAFDPGVVQAAANRGERAQVEQRAHLRVDRSRADHLGRPSAPEREQERVDEDGLARAGLSGHDVEARAEAHLRRVDDGEVSNLQRKEHGSAECVYSPGAAPASAHGAVARTM